MRWRLPPPGHEVQRSVLRELSLAQMLPASYGEPTMRHATRDYLKEIFGLFRVSGTVSAKNREAEQVRSAPCPPLYTRIIWQGQWRLYAKGIFRRRIHSCAAAYGTR